MLALNVASSALILDAFGKTNELNNLVSEPTADKIFALDIFANVVQDRINKKGEFIFEGLNNRSSIFLIYK